MGAIGNIQAEAVEDFCFALPRRIFGVVLEVHVVEVERGLQCLSDRTGGRFGYRRLLLHHREQASRGIYRHAEIRVVIGETHRQVETHHGYCDHRRHIHQGIDLAGQCQLDAPPGRGDNAHRDKDLCQRALPRIGAVELLLAFLHGRSGVPEFLRTLLLVTEGHGVAHALDAVGDKRIHLAQLLTVTNAVTAKPGNQPWQYQGIGSVERQHHIDQRRFNGPAPDQDEGRHVERGNRRRDGVCVERFDALTVGHYPTNSLAGLQFRGFCRRQRHHRIKKSVPERHQDMEGDVMAGVHLDVRGDCNHGAHQCDPAHLGPHHFPVNDTGHRVVHVDPDTGCRNSQHRRLAAQLDHPCR